MSRLITSVFNWITGKSNVPDIPSDIIFERNISSDNNFWISCILDPTLEVKYVNGVVTKLLETDMCVINNQYYYKPKTEKEMHDFYLLQLNCPVRLSLYKKKNSNMPWNVASCFVCKDSFNQTPRIVPNETFVVEHNDNAMSSRSTLQVDKINDKDCSDVLSAKVLGEMPKVVNFEHESTIQILFKNNSYVKEQELLDYKTMQGNKVQLSITKKQKLPLTIGVLSQCIFDITLKGRYLGRSIEKVEFIFQDIVYKVGINIDVIDSRIIIPQNLTPYVKREIDLKRLLELQNEHLIPGIYMGKKIKFPYRKIGLWIIPTHLTKCYWDKHGQLNSKISTEVKEKIEELYPATFENLTYQNYRAKFHTLLFMEEIEITISIQKYAKDRIHFESNGKYLILKIPDLSEQRPSLIPGDRVAVTDVPNCTKRLGENKKYEGIIHKVLADELWLIFDEDFHYKCGHWEYSVNFFTSRMIYRKQHEVINEVWKNSHLGESFLFPFIEELKYQPPKVEIMETNEISNTSSNTSNLNEANEILLPQPKIIKNIKWFNEILNFEQRSAVINILKGETRPMPYIIYGPPGTGKTITLTESIIQVYKAFPKSKLLVCAPTNFAVDILLGNLIHSGLFNKSIMKRLISYTYYQSSSYNMEYDDYCFLPELESSSHMLELDSKLIRKHDIAKLKIVVTTEGSAGLLYMMGFKKGTFSYIFVDEAGQSTEPEILLPLSFLDPSQDGQVVLAGDPQQLGPVVISNLANVAGLGQSLLARLVNYPSYMKDSVIFQEYNGYNPKVITHLIQNYRSLPEIVHIFSKLFYNSFLIATKVEPNLPERKLLYDLNENSYWDIGCKGPIIVHGIIGENHQEHSSPSWFNPHEAFQVVLYVTRLIKAGISTDEIGIITPYSSQVNKINELLKIYHSNIILPKVGTVEMFQGQEKTVIIISMVRSKCDMGNEKDKKFHIGFLNTKTRTNVALSRARALLIIIANPFTMKMSKQWKYVLSNAIKNNNYVGCNISDKTFK